MVIDLYLFCGKDGDSVLMRNPVKFNGFLYASNGIIGLRVPNTSDVVAVDAANYADYQIVPTLVEEQVNSIPRATFRPLLDTEVSELRCSICQVSAFNACESLALSLPCHHCFDEANLRQVVQVGGVWFSRKMMTLINRLPNLEIAIHVTNPEDCVPSLIRFDGGVGHIYPCVNLR